MTEILDDEDIEYVHEPKEIASIFNGFFTAIGPII